MRYLIVGLVLVTLYPLPTLAQPRPAAPAPVFAIFVDGNPNSGGRILAISPLAAPASDEIQSASHAVLRIGARRFVFTVGRVAPVGSLVGATRVRLRDESLALVDVAALLSEALTGKRDLVVLTQGTLDAGVVTAIAQLDIGSGPGRVAAQGATQATIFQAGRETTVVLESERAGPMLVLDGSERESECRHCDGMGGMP